MTTETTTERIHHRYSPSSLQLREACPGYDNRNETNQAALVGSAQHRVAETREDDNDLDDDQALAAADAIDFANRQHQLLVEERARAQADSDVPLAGVLELTEEYLPVDNIHFADGAVGTTAGYCDLAFINWNRTRGVLIDWKFGQFKVSKVSDNLQAIAYSLGLFRKFPTLDQIQFFFRMPAIDLTLEATFTRKQVPELYLRIQTVVARAREAHRLMAAGDWSYVTPVVPACNFCGNLAKCPAVAALVCKVGAKFYPLEIPTGISPNEILSSRDLGLGMRLAGVVSIWAKAFKTTLADRVIRGDAEIPKNYKIETRPNREVADMKLFKSVALTRLTNSELEECAEFSFGKVEGKISELAPRGSKKQSVLEFQEALLASGAVKRGDPFSFLKLVSGKDE